MFWERGYDGASVSELTHAMGVSPPSLYAAFGSKETLFREAVALYGRREGGTTLRALREQPTARAAVEAMLRDNAAIYADPSTPHGCLVVLGAPAGAPGDSAIREHLRDLRCQVLSALRDRLSCAVASGELAADTDVDALAAYYDTVLQGLSIQARDGASRATMEAVIDCAMAAWDAAGQGRGGAG